LSPDGGYNGLTAGTPYAGPVLLASKRSVAMSTFNEREKGFENKYKHDQDLQFKVGARRNRLLGEWVAGQLGLVGDAAASYAKDVVRADFAKAGDDDVLQKVLGDLTAKGVNMDARRLRKRMDDLLEEAKQQIQKE
jgi:hypothetical protein